MNQQTRHQRFSQCPNCHSHHSAKIRQAPPPTMNSNNHHCIDLPMKGYVYFPNKKGWRSMKESKNIAQEDVLALVKKHVKEKATYQGKETKCTCLHIFQADDALVDNCTRAILQYHELPSASAKTNYFLQWQQNVNSFKNGMTSDSRGRNKRKFLFLVLSELPPEPDDETAWAAFTNEAPHFHCTASACRLLGFARRK